MNRPNTFLLVGFSFSMVILCYSLSVLDFSFLRLFGIIVYLCICAFIVLDFVSSRDRLKNVSEMTYLCQVGRKTLTHWASGRAFGLSKVKRRDAGVVMYLQRGANDCIWSS